ncbi:uncharacterized protein LOC113216447 isoform X2 [Frankliniella occidentalis]|uniref:Uncharacterized protein LOC113216447 isoform X2 n=1 Tax=Frankliniella occidentalis TaxID=133901 RepID=A0A9C6U5S6_FRAOC|nr:uncharacterized protein LOC113216447 isoform X2 [Frankliniella occidentalis]
MARRLSLFGLLTLALASPTTTEATMLDAGACGVNITASETPPTKAAVMEAWTAFLGADPGSVKLLAFDGTILEQNRKEVSLRRSLSPLHLHRGAVMKYVSASSWQTFSEEPLEPWGIVQVEGMIRKEPDDGRELRPLGPGRGGAAGGGGGDGAGAAAVPTG